ncbi:MAG: SDR family NAD(P)-dependent oxidoreductase [Oscillospiraceae bacterium]
MGMEQLVEFSNRYGRDEFYVLAGGGNTSAKEDGVLYVKGSGTSLATIQPAGFVRMDMAKLSAMLTKDYPAGDAEREAASLADMMAARLPGEEQKRPSVECILHATFPFQYVLHVHPPLINGLTCGQGGEALCRELLGEDVVWIPLTKPGYILGKTCYDAFQAFKAARGFDPQVVMLQNHGIFVAADTVEEIDAKMADVVARLKAHVKRQPDLTPIEYDKSKAAEMAPALRMLFLQGEESAAAVFCTNNDVLALAKSAETVKPLIRPFSPDHIVYCKDEPLYLTEGEEIGEAFAAFKTRKGYAPKIVMVQNLGFFALGKSWKDADTARSVWLDAIKIAVYSESFGGYLQLPEDFTDFILNWEFESYRQKVALGASATSRMKGKICIVTGAAQGFGQGIARGLASQGACVAVADLNQEGAAVFAEELNFLHGAGTSIAVKVDVGDEASVAAMVQETVLTWGGLDVLVSNAGIAIAGSLPEMTKEKFELVTKVNYTGYFLCTKYATEPMKIQRHYAPDYWMDVIEINSKSGLEGSNKNFAYAGSKFGGVGLTQSFALELVEHGIKVNAVCPGNLLDGPLWSDPEKGLFRQYFEAGKVPGATCVEDVRRFYESKVPMNRGCTVEDVTCAILYVVEQKYETGQAIPVTGGQVMLK